MFKVNIMETNQTNGVIDHMDGYTVDKPHQCGYCNKKFQLANDCISHMKCYGEKHYNCKQCNAYFSNGDLFGHMRIHTGERVYKCSLCGIPFSEYSYLMRHMSKHTSKKPLTAKKTYQCDKCEKYFPSKHDLTAHIINIHTRSHREIRPQIPDQSRQCDMSFSGNKDLRIHMKNHTSEKDQCKQCNIYFSCNSDLINHMKNHTSENVQCSKCGIVFYDKSFLISHLCIGMKIYKCNKCDNAFTQSNELEKHVGSHTDNAFTQSNELEKHVGSHTDETVQTIRHSEHVQSITESSIAHNISISTPEIIPTSSYPNSNISIPLKQIDNTGENRSDIFSKTYFFDLSVPKENKVNGSHELQVEIKEEQMNYDNNDSDDICRSEIPFKEKQKDKIISDPENMIEPKYEIKDEGFIVIGQKSLNSKESDILNYLDPFFDKEKPMIYQEYFNPKGPNNISNVDEKSHKEPYVIDQECVSSIEPNVSSGVDNPNGKFESDLKKKAIDKESFIKKQRNFEDNNQELLRNFISKKVENQTRWYCKCCKEFNTILGNNQNQDWHCNGTFKEKYSDLKSCMAYHIRLSINHEASMRKQIESKKLACQKIQMESKNIIASITSNQLPLKCTENICLAVESYQHITDESKEWLKNKKVALTVSDNKESTFCKPGVDMQQHNDEVNYSLKKYNFGDVSLLLERMIFPSELKWDKHIKDEKWVLETIHLTNKVIGLVVTHPKLGQILRDYSEEESEGVYHNFDIFMVVQYSEFFYQSLLSLLKNLYIMTEALPKIIVSDCIVYDRLTINIASQILKIIHDPLFIARVILLSKVFYVMSVLEKSAGREALSPFKLVGIIEDLKNELHGVKQTGRKEIINLVFTGKFRSSYILRNNIHSFEVNLKNINLPEYSPITGNDCFSQFEKWVDNLLERIPVFLEVPERMKLAVKIFSLPVSCDEISVNDFNDKLRDLQKLLSLVNIDFDKCSDICHGYEFCKAIQKQFKTFLENVSQCKQNFIVENRLEYDKLFSFYFRKINKAINQTLDVRHILQALEISLLIESSNSSTKKNVLERSKTILCSKGKKGKNAMVDVNATLKQNSSIQDLDVTMPCKKNLDNLNPMMSVNNENSVSEPRIQLQNMKKSSIFELKSSHPLLKNNPIKLVSFKFKENNLENENRVIHKLDKLKEIEDQQFFSESNLKHHNNRKREIKVGMTGFTEIPNDGESLSVKPTNENRKIHFENMFQDYEDNYNTECKSKLKIKDKIHKQIDKRKINSGLEDPIIDENLLKTNKKMKVTDKKKLLRKCCVDGCHLPQRRKKRSQWRWIGCEEGDTCLSHKKRFKEGFDGGSWFHSSCLGFKITQTEAEKMNFLCLLCEEGIKKNKDKVDRNNEIIALNKIK